MKTVSTQFQDELNIFKALEIRILTVKHTLVLPMTDRSIDRQIVPLERHLTKRSKVRAAENNGNFLDLLERRKSCWLL